MTDQYAFFLVVGAAFILGMFVPVLWQRFFGKKVDIDVLKERIYDFVVSMDESNPDASGLVKKERVLALIKKYVPGASDELASLLVDSVVGVWRLESEGVSPKEKASIVAK